MMDSATLLAGLPDWGFGLVLVFSRIGAACTMLPGIGEAELPATVRLGFTLVLTALLLPVLAPLLPPVPAAPWVLFAMVAAEIATGLWFGWLVRLVVQTLPVAGQFIATMMGLASTIQPDPDLGPQSTALARLFSLIAPGTLLPVADSTQSVVTAVGETFALALRLAAPFVAAGLVWQGALGLLSRLVPNLQVFAAAMPGQILGGLALLLLLCAGVIAAWQGELRSAFTLLPGL
jgi:flagellar biosynthetic protein FliR